MFQNDLRLAIRRMRQTPGFTLAAIATLALGLGLTTAVLSITDAIFLKALPLANSSGLALVDQTTRTRSGAAFPMSLADYSYYRDHARVFSDLAAHYPTSPIHMSLPEGGFGINGSVVTANYFGVLRLQPALGRFFTADEDQVPGRNPVVVLGHDLWRRRYEANAGILGTTVRLNGTDFTVVGVAPAGFRGVIRGLPSDVWIPSAMFKVGYRFCDAFSRECRIVSLVGRLADGTTMGDAQAEMSLLARQIEDAFPETNEGRGVTVRPTRGIRIDEQSQYRPIVTLIGVAGGLVLLVSSSNVAGLLLARGLRRRREIAIHFALGASRGRIIQQLLVESTLLAFAGGTAGLLVASWATGFARGFFRLLAAGGNVELSLEPRVAAIAFGVALVTGIATGIAPALQATRSEAFPALKDDTAGAGSRRTRLRDGLIVVQVAVSVLLLATGGLVVRSFLVLHRGPGFDPDSVAVVRLRPSLVGYSAERSWAFQRDVIRRLEAIPGVIAASPANVPPLPGWVAPEMPIQLVGDPTDPARAFRTATTTVGPRYFKTLGVTLAEGREFDDRDRAGGVRVAIVNETLARHFWPEGRAIGNRVTIAGTPAEIVGVVRNVQFVSALGRPAPFAYFDFWQQDTSDNWSHDSRTHVRVAGKAAAMLPRIRRAIAESDPDVPVSEASPLSAHLDETFADVRTARALLVTFGALALVLSAIGLYAALAFTVGQRRREIAIRLALGAERRHVGGLVVRGGLALVSAGVAGGLAASALAGPSLAHLLYGVSPRDPLALTAGPAILAAVSLLAIWLPARRAMAMDPIAALRSE